MPSFATPEELQLFRGVATIKDERAQALLDDATGLIQEHCDQEIFSSSSELRLNPSRTRRLFLPERPVTHVTSVVIDDFELSSLAYKAESYGVLRRIDGDFWDAEPGGIVVTYTHGFTEIPAFVKEICKSVAARAYTTVPSTVETFVPAESAGFAPNLFLAPSEKTSLDRLRLTVFA